VNVGHQTVNVVDVTGGRIPAGAEILADGGNASAWPNDVARRTSSSRRLVVPACPSPPVGTAGSWIGSGEQARQAWGSRRRPRP